MLRFNNLKLCKNCGKEKQLSDFRIRKKANGLPSYGNCILCERTYDHKRRRAKGIKARQCKSTHKSQLPVSSVSITDKARIRAMVNRPDEKRPIHNKQCKECNAPFKGYLHQTFCNAKCSRRFHRRIRRQKERALLRMVKVDNVNPVKVFETYQWHCSYCNVHTPPHLKGSTLDNAPELDHIIPLSKGGLHSYVNTQLLCRKCNRIKSNNIIPKYGT